MGIRARSSGFDPRPMVCRHGSSPDRNVATTIPFRRTWSAARWRLANPFDGTFTRSIPVQDRRLPFLLRCRPVSTHGEKTQLARPSSDPSLDGVVQIQPFHPHDRGTSYAERRDAALPKARGIHWRTPACRSSARNRVEHPMGFTSALCQAFAATSGRERIAVTDPAAALAIR